MGIPVSVGVRPPKTLAKLANQLAKKDPASGGVLALDTADEQEAALDRVALTDLWGVAGRMAERLAKIDITTPLQLRQNGLKARQPRRFRRTTDSQHAFPVAPNRLDQDFAAAAPNEKWGTDLSYIWTREGWLYLAVVIDLYARRVVGWAAGDRLHKELALTALRRALVMRRPAAGLLHHSDRGSQYCLNEYQAELRRHGIVTSMSGKGNCYDNAMVETFFKTLKSELVWRTAFHTRTEATEALARYIDGFYNPRRRHSALGFVSPIQFEKRSANQTALH